MTARLLHGARVVAGDRVLEDGWVLVQGDRIAAVGNGPPPARAEPEGLAELEERRPG